VVADSLTCLLTELPACVQLTDLLIVGRRERGPGGNVSLARYACSGQGYSRCEDGTDDLEQRNSLLLVADLWPQKLANPIVDAYALTCDNSQNYNST